MHGVFTVETFNKIWTVYTYAAWKYGIGCNKLGPHKNTNKKDIKKTLIAADKLGLFFLWIRTQSTPPYVLSPLWPSLLLFHVFASLYTLSHFKRNLASNIKINRKKEFESTSYAGILLKKIRRKDLLPLMLVRKQTFQSQDIFPFCKFRSSKSNLSHSSFAASVHVIVTSSHLALSLDYPWIKNPKKYCALLLLFSAIFGPLLLQFPQSVCTLRKS